MTNRHPQFLAMLIPGQTHRLDFSVLIIVELAIKETHT
jgi:hypothetical protein